MSPGDIILAISVFVAVGIVVIGTYREWMSHKSKREPRQ